MKHSLGVRTVIALSVILLFPCSRTVCITCGPQNHICGRNVVPRSELGELFTSLVGGGSPAGVVYQGLVVAWVFW